jgi:hypothetical protein
MAHTFAVSPIMPVWVTGEVGAASLASAPAAAISAAQTVNAKSLAILMDTPRFTSSIAKARAL